MARHTSCKGNVDPQALVILDYRVTVNCLRRIFIII
jgi:hypothetical protein